MTRKGRQRTEVAGDQVLLLLLGFVLTTVLGGLLGYLFQRRAWSHQHEVQRRSAEREAAAAALNELSSLLDERRYRMLLVYWRLDWDHREELARAVTGYRVVLEEWNDGLNRRLAMVATHFGSKLKRELDVLYEEYRQAGQLLEKAIRERRDGSAVKVRSQLVKLLEGLNVRNYSFAEAGLSAILAGRFGSDLTPAQRGSAETPPRADVGAHVLDD